ncbi:putative Histone-lysine N-methyltransferase ATXR5 [Dichanthelium oligosanthes]|uniref:Putative Histone-lysine N-methyltransferase ATXR5 n=1 Tax=Dichanthelium oligosanthes TaxID=888268 RepID=A0A1E5V7R6_9POAL|nr:putative Histone-lysine N-methyltransferase ATXR5 [Dichanthelium oligosanthes]
MGRRAPSSTSSPELRRKRTAAPPPEPPTPRRFCSMADVMRRSRPVDAPPPVARAREAIYDAVLCDTCGSGDRDDDLLLCDRCDRGRHTFCLRPIAAKVPIGPWFCPDCAPPAPPLKSESCGPSRRPRSRHFPLTLSFFRLLPSFLLGCAISHSHCFFCLFLFCFGDLLGFPMKQTKIVDFFRIQKDDQDGLPAKCRLSQGNSFHLHVRRRRKRSLVMHKKRRRILPFIPTEDRARRLKQMASLATALTSSKTEFSNELTYMPNMAPRSSNEARLEEGGMQTDADIKDLTFIAEYTGDVDYLENRANDDCDCIMTLLLTADPSQRLVICPDKRGNISRFISGINNHTPDGKKKQNVKCVRYDIDGESHVLLVACRDIACGEKLYYDYNGYEHAYPTHHFL